MHLLPILHWRILGHRPQKFLWQNLQDQLPKRSNEKQAVLEGAAYDAGHLICQLKTTLHMRDFHWMGRNGNQGFFQQHALRLDMHFLKILSNGHR